MGRDIIMRRTVATKEPVGGVRGREGFDVFLSRKKKREPAFIPQRTIIGIQWTKKKGAVSVR